MTRSEERGLCTDKGDEDEFRDWSTTGGWNPTIV